MIWKTCRQPEWTAAAWRTEADASRAVCGILVKHLKEAHTRKPEGIRTKEQKWLNLLLHVGPLDGVFCSQHSARCEIQWQCICVTSKKIVIPLQGTVSFCRLGSERGLWRFNSNYLTVKQLGRGNWTISDCNKKFHIKAVWWYENLTKKTYSMMYPGIGP